MTIVKNDCGVTLICSGHNEFRVIWDSLINHFILASHSPNEIKVRCQVRQFKTEECFILKIKEILK